MKSLYYFVFLILVPSLIEAQSGEWTWMAGSNGLNSAGNFGTKGVASASNQPPGLYAPGFWTDTAHNLWVYGGIGSNIGFGNNAMGTLWQFNSSSLLWTWMSGVDSANSPALIATAAGVFSALNQPGSSGYGINTWTDKNNHLWMYGGRSGNTLGSYILWQYNPVNNEWAWMTGGINPDYSLPVYGTEGIGGAENTPGSRSEGNATWTDNAGNLWLFGGYGVNGNNMQVDLNDMWEYDISTGQWIWMSGSNDPDNPGIYGPLGTPSVDYYPSARECNLHWKDSTGNFWLSGGQNRQYGYYYNDVWEFNPATLEWTLVKGSALPDTTNISSGNCQANANNQEGGRYENRAMWQICDNVVINYGGYYSQFDDDVQNNLWAYLLTQDEWLEISSSSEAGNFGTEGISSAQNYPPGRFGSCSFADKRNNLWLFGGRATINNGYYNDVWRYVIDTACFGGYGCGPTCTAETPVLNADTAAICAGSSTSICAPANFASYNWNNGTTTRCLTAGNSGTYFLNVTDANGCTAQSTNVTISVSQPMVVIGAAPDTICSGDSAIMCANPGFAFYAWSNNATGSCIEAKLQGSYHVNVTDNNGCTAQSANLEFTVLPSPSVTISATADSICSGQTASLCATSSFSSYAWSPASGGANTSCIEAGNEGTYYLVVTGSNGCTAQSNNIGITVFQLPSVSIPSTDTFCSGGSVQVCGTPGFASYTWSNNATTRCIEAGIAGVYFLTASSSNGCAVQSNSLHLSVFQTPPVSIPGTDSVCSGDSVQICAPQGFVSYTWSNNNATTCIEAKQQGSYHVSVTDNHGCTAESNGLSVTVLPSPSLMIGASADSICAGDSTQICGPNGFSSYLWSPASGGATTTCIEAKNNGTYYLNASAANGCVAQSNNIRLTVSQLPPVNIAANPDTICNGDSAQICAPNNFSSYRWSSNAASTCIVVSNSGNLQVSVTDNNGCTATSNNLGFTVLQPAVSIAANANSICAGDSTQICTTPGFATYTWNPAIGGTAGNCIQATSPGTYYLNVSDNNGCSAQSNNLIITALQPPSVSIAPVSDTLCPGDSTHICATPGFASYLWNPASGGATTSCIEANDTGSYFVIVNVNGCSGRSANVALKFFPMPSLSLTANSTSLCSSDSVKICATAGFVLYSWNPATGGGTGLCIEAKSPGNYFVNATDANGCSAQSDSVNVALSQLPPVTLTANADSVCQGRSVQVCAASGFSSYTWNTGATGTCIEVQNTGHYDVTASNGNGCTAQSNPLGITVLPLPVASINANFDTICPSDSARICAAIGFSSYVWSIGLTGPCIEVQNAGDYYVTVTDNGGCTAESNHVGIAVLQSPPISISRSGDTLSVYNATNIQWFLNGNPISGATHNNYIAHSAGTYEVQTTNADGCSTFSSPIVLTGLENITESEYIFIYPNPLSVGNWQLAVSNDLIGAQIEILDDNGRVVYKSAITKTLSEIPAPFADGVYLLKVTSGTAVVGRKLVKL